MIEKVVFVRHGHYDDDSLSLLGEERIRDLVPRVRTVFAGASPILLVSSPVLRAMQTAKILGDGLGIGPIRSHEELAAEYRGNINEGLRETHRAFLRIVGDAQHVLVSTHQPIAKYYAWYCAKQLLGMDVPGVRCEYGDASCLDCVAKTLTQI